MTWHWLAKTLGLSAEEEAEVTEPTTPSAATPMPEELVQCNHEFDWSNRDETLLCIHCRIGPIEAWERTRDALKAAQQNVLTGAEWHGGAGMTEPMTERTAPGEAELAQVLEGIGRQARGGYAIDAAGVLRLLAALKAAQKELRWRVAAKDRDEIWANAVRLATERAEQAERERDALRGALDVARDEFLESLRAYHNVKNHTGLFSGCFLCQTKKVDYDEKVTRAALAQPAAPATERFCVCSHAEARHRADLVCTDCLDDQNDAYRHDFDFDQGETDEALREAAPATEAE